LSVRLYHVDDLRLEEDLMRWMSRVGVALLAVVTAACNVPAIADVSVAGGPNNARVRPGGELIVTASVEKRGADVRQPTVSVQQVVNDAATGPELRKDLAGGSGDPTPYTATFPGSDTTSFVQGSIWRALARVPYAYGWSEADVTRSVTFDVLEQRGCSGMLDVPGVDPWRLVGISRDDEDGQIAPVTPEFFPDLNYPTVRPRDRAFGFTVPALPAARFGDTEGWLAEFLSPPVWGNANGPTYSAATRTYVAQVRTNVTNLKLSAYLNLQLVNASGGRPFAIANFLDVPGDDQWHALTLDFSTNSEIPNDPTMRLASISVRVFGTKSNREADEGKRVLIDQVCATQ
jgi:hypothetical protein